MSQQQIKSKIIEYYRDILCREPDKDGLDLYIKMANNGTPLEKIRELFLKSDEYSFLKSTKFLKYAPLFKTSFSDDEVKKMFDSVDGWYHSFKIGNVENTNTKSSLNYQMWISQIIPTDLSGKKVLDIGANDGFYSFLCESRGAERILAVDNNQRELSDVYLKKFKEFTGKRGYEECVTGNDMAWPPKEPMFKNTGPTERFQILKKILNSKVDYKLMNVYDVDSIEETFDIALLFGVYYHLENPVLAFQKIFPKINDSLFLSGHIIETGEPKMYQDLSYWDSMSHLAPSDRPREQNPRWIASSEYLLRIGERIGFKKCILLDTLDMKFDNYYKETSQTVSRRPYSSTANSDTNDLLYESKIGLFKFSK